MQATIKKSRNIIRRVELYDEVYDRTAGYLDVVDFPNGCSLFSGDVKIHAPDDGENAEFGCNLPSLYSNVSVDDFVGQVNRNSSHILQLVKWTLYIKNGRFYVLVFPYNTSKITTDISVHFMKYFKCTY